MTSSSVTIFEVNNFEFQYPFSDKKISFPQKFNINLGDTILISGASGGGKSTFLYALKGLVPNIISGTIRGELLFYGKPITEVSTLLKVKIALLQQNPDSQMISRLVLDELAFGLENLKYNRDEILKKINNYATLFSINYLLNRSISSLSGGEKQKVALVSLLLTDPEVLLLDEPTAFLDPESVLPLLEFLKKLKGKITIIIIEHNLHYLYELCPLTHHLTINADGIITQLSDVNLSSYNFELFQNQEIVKNTNNQLGQKILEIKNLNYKSLLQNINFNLYNNEILGIIGKSGSGKSTLLKIIARLIKTKELIYLNSQEIYTINYKRFYGQLGLLFQNPENHFLFDTVKRELDNDYNLLNLFDLERVSNQNPFTLSEGQKRRLSVGILCLAKYRKILLLDEPTFGQDESNKQILIDLIFRLRNSGMSFIIVSHDYFFIEKICNRVLKIKNKTIV